MCFILTIEKFDLIALANCIFDGLGSIETTIGLPLVIGICACFLNLFLLLRTSLKSLSTCVVSSAVILAADKSLSIWLILKLSLKKALISRKIL